MLCCAPKVWLGARKTMVQWRATRRREPHAVSTPRLPDGAESRGWQRPLARLPNPLSPCPCPAQPCPGRPRPAPPRPPPCPALPRPAHALPTLLRAAKWPCIGASAGASTVWECPAQQKCQRTISRTREPCTRSLPCSRCPELSVAPVSWEAPHARQDRDGAKICE